MKEHPDIIVSTTGRLLDHMEKGNFNYYDYQDLKTIVLDEADQMLDMGFKEDLDNILFKINKTIK